ncbi:unnamed protein product, partial [Prorocentrum cordatum]
ADFRQRDKNKKKDTGRVFTLRGPTKGLWQAWRLRRMFVCYNGGWEPVQGYNWGDENEVPVHEGVLVQPAPRVVSMQELSQLRQKRDPTFWSLPVLAPGIWESDTGVEQGGFANSSAATGSQASDPMRVEVRQRESELQ